MDINQIDWREYIDQKKFDEVLGDILYSQGYYVTIFNNEGEQLNIRNPEEWNHLACKSNGKNGDLCKEHYRLAQRVITGENESLCICMDDKERILLSTPLRTSSGKSLGAIVACRRGKMANSQSNGNEVNFLKSISSLLADKIYQSIEIRKLTEELNTKFEELSLLYEIGEKTQVSDREDESVEYIVNRAMEAINPSLVVWSAPKGDTNKIYKNSERDSQEKDISDVAIDEICRKVAKMINRLKEPLILNNLNKYREFAGILPESINLLSVPLMSDNKGFGSLNFIECNPKKVFLNNHLKLMESISKTTVTILKNSDLYGKLQRLFFNVIRMLLGIIESKDSYTEGHSKRVYKISIQFGKLLKLSRKDIYDLQWASILHDIGKITIPSHVLRKPGKLTSEEFELIKSHPANGAELISTIDEFRTAIKGIRHHHERMDGRGYPDGLGGEEIPLIARIICIADTFDALNSARPYRAKPSQEFILEELKRSTPNQFDPVLMELFLNNYKLFLKFFDGDESDLFEDTDMKGIW